MLWLVIGIAGYVVFWFWDYMTIEFAILSLSRRTQETLEKEEPRGVNLDWAYELIFVTPFVIFHFYPLIRGDLKAVIVGVPVIFVVSSGYARVVRLRRTKAARQIAPRLIRGYALFAIALAILMFATVDDWAIRIWF